MNGIELLLWIILLIFTLSGLGYTFVKLLELIKQSTNSCNVRNSPESKCDLCSFSNFAGIPWPICYVFIFSFITWLFYATSGYGILGGLHLSISDFITGSSEFLKSLRLGGGCNLSELEATNTQINIFQENKYLFEAWSTMHQLLSYLVLGAGGIKFVVAYLITISGNVGEIKDLLNGKGPKGGNDNNGNNGNNGNGGAVFGSQNDLKNTKDEFKDLINTIENINMKINYLNSKISRAKESFESEIELIKNNIVITLENFKNNTPEVRGEFDENIIKKIEKKINLRQEIYDVDYLLFVFRGNPNISNLPYDYLHGLILRYNLILKILNDLEK